MTPGEIQSLYKKSTTNMSAAQLKEVEQLVDVQIRVLAKRANQRLRELEKQGLYSSRAYQKIETFKYDEAEFVTRTDKGQLKFVTSTRGRTLEQKREELKQLDRFLTAKSSTVRGHKSTYKKSFEQFKKNNPDINLTYDEWSTAFSEDVLKKAMDKWGSKTVLRLYQDAADKEHLIRVFERGIRDNWDWVRVEVEYMGRDYDSMTGEEKGEFQTAFDEWLTEGWS